MKRLRDYPVLADENLHPSVVAFLRTEAFDVLDVRERGLVGSDDLSLIPLAYAQHRVIVTQDRDFGALAIAGMETNFGKLFL